MRSARPAPIKPRRRRRRTAEGARPGRYVPIRRASARRRAPRHRPAGRTRPPCPCPPASAARAAPNPDRDRYHEQSSGRLPPRTETEACPGRPSTRLPSRGHEAQPARRLDLERTLRTVHRRSGTGSSPSSSPGAVRVAWGTRCRMRSRRRPPQAQPQLHASRSAATPPPDAPTEPERLLLARSPPASSTTPDRILRGGLRPPRAAADDQRGQRRSRRSTSATGSGSTVTPALGCGVPVELDSGRPGECRRGQRISPLVKQRSSSKGSAPPHDRAGCHPDAVLASRACLPVTSRARVAAAPSTSAAAWSGWTSLHASFATATRSWAA